MESDPQKRPDFEEIIPALRTIRRDVHILPAEASQVETHFSGSAYCLLAYPVSYHSNLLLRATVNLMRHCLHEALQSEKSEKILKNSGRHNPLIQVQSALGVDSINALQPQRDSLDARSGLFASSPRKPTQGSEERARRSASLESRRTM